ncbi:MAG: hypothetical protein M2R45_05275 [Verrucomicrobia subdivision 3 bacterium]|nr:hypothetical protein [Limisphaerales bacterium]MCS1417473.1 hypothetical protein [Limisphaerales bacterium]
MACCPTAHSEEVGRGSPCARVVAEPILRANNAILGEDANVGLDRLRLLGGGLWRPERIPSGSWFVGGRSPLGLTG